MLIKMKVIQPWLGVGRCLMMGPDKLSLALVFRSSDYALKLLLAFSPPRGDSLPLSSGVRLHSSKGRSPACFKRSPWWFPGSHVFSKLLTGSPDLDVGRDWVPLFLGFLGFILNAWMKMNLAILEFWRNCQFISFSSCAHLVKSHNNGIINCTIGIKLIQPSLPNQQLQFPSPHWVLVSFLKVQTVYRTT